MLTPFYNFIFYHTPIFYLIQSVWRDEAFSYFMAKPNILQVIVNTAHDFNPPVYYLLLHFWMKLVGQSDEGLRLLSFFAHLGSVYIAFIFGQKLMLGKSLFHAKKFAWYLAAFTFFNPMLLYYAFEMRMYSFYVLFTFAVVYFFYIKNWKWYTIATVVGLYTHSFFSLILVSFIVYAKFTHQLNRKNLWLILKPLLFFIPWLPILALQFINSKNSWLFPVDLKLVFSVLGNLFTGFEGTPGNYWGYAIILSIIILIYIIIGLRQYKKESLLFTTPIFFPLFLILGYSMIKQPLFVNRYMIFITVFEVLAISFSIWTIKNKLFRSVSVFFWLILIIIIDIIAPPFHKKTDFKSTFFEINKSAKADDFVYAKTPIGLLESAYYFRNKNKVFVYNPYDISIPNYIGVTVVFPDISRGSFPPAPSRTFIVADDANYEITINK